jgi:hypothetical protein
MGEIPIQDAKQFFDQIDTEKMITMTTDGGANPNPGPAGWGVLVRQNGKFLCLWKAYPRASNNVMEISAVIAGLNYLPANMIVWLSTEGTNLQNRNNVVSSGTVALVVIMSRMPFELTRAHRTLIIGPSTRDRWAGLAVFTLDSSPRDNCLG